MNDELIQLLLIGPTGSGKSTLGKRLLGFKEEENYPTVGQQRTTTVRTDFFRSQESGYFIEAELVSEDTLRSSLFESVGEVRGLLQKDPGRLDSDPMGVFSKLLEKPDSIMRLQYIVGKPPVRKHSMRNMDDFLFKRLYRELNDLKTARASRATKTKKNIVDLLVNEVGKCVQNLPGNILKSDGHGWETDFRWSSTSREEFIRIAVQMSGRPNNKTACKMSLAPIVLKMSVSGGDFHPPWDNTLRMCVSDSVGLGHQAETATKVPPELCQYMSSDSCDVVLLLLPCVTAATGTVRAIITEAGRGGFSHKLIPVLTKHDEQILKDDGESEKEELRHEATKVFYDILSDLRKDEAKRDTRVLSKLSIDRIESNIKDNGFVFVGEGEEYNDTLKCLTEKIKIVASKDIYPYAAPVRDETNEEKALDLATSAFNSKMHKEFSKGGYYWQTAWAFTRRVAYEGLSSYKQANPVSDYVNLVRSYLWPLIEPDRCAYIPERAKKEAKEKATDRFKSNATHLLYKYVRKEMIGRHIGIYRYLAEKHGKDSGNERKDALRDLLTDPSIKAAAKRALREAYVQTEKESLQE